MSMVLKKLIAVFVQIGVDEVDSDELRLRKNMIVASYIISASAASTWGITYILQGEVFGGGALLTAVMTASFFFIKLIQTREINQFQFVMYFIYLVVPAIVTWFLGGFNNSSVIMIWSFLSPTLALMTSTLKRAIRWMTAYVVLFVVTGFIQPFLPNQSLLPDGLLTFMLVVNLVLTSIIIFIVLRYFIDLEFNS